MPRTTFVICCLLTACASTVRSESLIDESSPLETIATDFELADGPAWNGWSLDFPDVKAQKLYRYVPKTKKLSVLTPDAGRISAAYFSHGKLFLSDNGAGRIAELKKQSILALTLAAGEGRNIERPNDLVVDRHGGIYFTLTRQGRVMYRPPKGEVLTAVEKIDTPNGLTLSPDGSTLYVASYVPKKIHAFDVQRGGKAANGRVLAAMDDGDARGADGMTIDRAGNVYCAGATDVWIWNPDGKLLAKIACPTRPINCTFGDQDMRSLYITGFGGLYRQRMNACGKPSEPPRHEVSAQNAKRPSTEVPSNVTLSSDVVFAQAGPRKLLGDLCLPKSDRVQAARPAIVVVHGGGWRNGYKSKFRALALNLASRGYVTFAIEYRLAYEAKFPAAIHDCNAAVRFLRARAQVYNIDPDRIGAVGGSAGGHLVGLMATAGHIPQLQGDGGHADQSSKLQAAIVMAGPMRMTTGSVAERSRAGTANSNVWLGRTIDEAPKLYALADAHLHISKDSTPILFMTGEHDSPERNQPSREKLKEAGVWTGLKVYKDGKHGCWNQHPWFEQMADDMDAFFQNALKSRSH